MDCQWLPHWKCTVNLAEQNGFTPPNSEIGQKMANGQLLIQALDYSNDFLVQLMNCDCPGPLKLIASKLVYHIWYAVYYWNV